MRSSLALRRFWDELPEIFAVDLRSLAITRIGTALVLLFDIVSRARDIAMFYGDGGVLPSSLMHSFWTGEWAWSLHLILGGPFLLLVFLFLLHAAAALFLLVGYKTRYAAVLTWILTLSLDAANPLILIGGDFLLKALLFTGIFLPWGAKFSLDAGEASGEQRVLSPWSAALLIQVGLIYFFAAMYKHSTEWQVTGNALYDIASIDQYATPLSHVLVQFPDLLRVATFSIVAFQHAALFLLFFPFYNRYVRAITALSLIAMHIFFGLATHLGIFSWISVAALLPFVPSFVWDRVYRFFNARGWNVGATFTGGKEGSRGGTFTFLGILYVAYVFVWQAADFWPLRDKAFWPALSIPAKVLQIDQRWNLFAPEPYKDDGWDVIAGRLSSGRQVDVFTGKEDVSFEKPKDVFALYGTTRRRQYSIELRRRSEYRPYYASYLCRVWNANHEEKLVSLEHFYMHEETVPPGTLPKEPQRRTLLSYSCL